MSEVLHTFLDLKKKTPEHEEEAFLNLKGRHFLKYIFDAEHEPVEESRVAVRPLSIGKDDPGRWVLASNNFLKEEHEG